MLIQRDNHERQARITNLWVSWLFVNMIVFSNNVSEALLAPKDAESVSFANALTPKAWILATRGWGDEKTWTVNVRGPTV